jgi:hypothetical protein
LAGSLNATGRHMGESDVFWRVRVRVRVSVRVRVRV